MLTTKTPRTGNKKFWVERIFKIPVSESIFRILSFLVSWSLGVLVVKMNFQESLT